MTDQVCPLCEQGMLHRYIVTQSGEIFRSCEDCDATWSDEVAPEKFTSTFLDDFLAARAIDRDNWFAAVTKT